MFWADIRGHHGKVWDYEPGDYYMGSHKGHKKHLKIMYYYKDFLSKEQKNYISILDKIDKDDVGLGTGNSWLSHTIVERKEIREIIKLNVR